MSVEYAQGVTGNRLSDVWISRSEAACLRGNTEGKRLHFATRQKSHL
jgi:hypothetical protein